MRFRVLLLAVALAISTIPFRPGPVDAVSCDQLWYQEAYDTVVPTSAAYIAQTKIMMRGAVAYDWNIDGGGHTGAKIWVLDSATPDAFVEVGFVRGWEGADVYRYYTANAHMPYGNDYLETLLTPNLTWVRNTATTFSGDSDGHISLQTYDGQTATGYWSGHSNPIVDYQVGGESTSVCSRLDTTYVVTNQYRRISDGGWASASSGTLAGSATMRAATCPGWPVNFRFWQNSQTDTSHCG